MAADAGTVLGAPGDGLDAAAAEPAELAGDAVWTRGGAGAVDAKVMAGGAMEGEGVGGVLTALAVMIGAADGASRGAAGSAGSAQATIILA